MRAALAALALSGCAGHWSGVDTSLAVAYIATTTIDWKQTMKITRDCDEANPIIGECGQNVAPSLYFPIVIVGVLLIADLVGNNSWRSAILAVGTGVEGHTIYGNWRAGEWPGP